MRPQPPGYMVEFNAPDTFRADAELERWVRETFVDEGSPLTNEVHAPLRQAALGFMWSNVAVTRQKRLLLGQCEMPQDSAASWQKARGIWNLKQLFDGLPDFIITLNAGYCATCSDRAFMALVEHELMHAAQATDRYGQPMFDKATGQPKFAMRGHDCEEFVGVVERYGATSPQLRTMAESIMAGPLLDDEELSIACGTCLT